MLLYLEAKDVAGKHGIIGLYYRQMRIWLFIKGTRVMFRSAEWIRRRHRRVLRGLRVVFLLQIVISVGVALILDLLKGQTPNLLITLTGVVVGVLLVPQARQLLKWLYLPTLLLIDGVHITALLWYTDSMHLARGSLWALGYIPILIAAGRWWSYAGGAVTLIIVLLADAAVLFSRLEWRVALPIFVFQAVTASLGAWAAALTEARTRRDLLQREAHQLSEQRLATAQELIQAVVVNLHDLGHHVQVADSYVRSDVAAVERHLQHLEHGLRATITDIQRALRTFGPSPLLNRTLPEAIAQQLKLLQESYQIGYQFRCDAHLPELSPIIADFLFQAAQELLHNVGHHSGASKVLVHLHGDAVEHQVTLQVIDDGSGFSTSLDQLSTEQALGRIQRKVTEFGGSLQITSQPQTIVTVEVPTHHSYHINGVTLAS